MANKHIDEATGTETVGHEWDGIEELNTPLPRWWLWTFYITILFAVGYVIAYPAWPMIDRATGGMLGWSSRGQLAQSLADAEADKRSIADRIGAIALEKLPADKALMRQAVAGGAAAFKVNCVQCHGSGAAGSQTLGYPNLNDDDWLWGGTLEDIHYTITHGIRQQEDDEKRQSQMPPFEGAFDAKQLDAVASHVLALRGKSKDNAEGAKLFADNCAACHGPNGGGDRKLGAPRLNDAIWLYGGTKEDIEKQVLNPRMGVMPHWGGRLSPVTIKMLAAYVWSLGGGEATPGEAKAGAVSPSNRNGDQAAGQAEANTNERP